MAVQGVSLVVDFETLGVSRDSVVLSGAAICFLGEEILWKEYEEFDVLAQIHSGSSIEKGTISWWRHTDRSEFSRLLYDGYGYIREFIEQIQEKAGKIKEFWSRGQMDFDIFNYHLSNPLEYYVFRDIRTLDSLGLAKMQPNEHHAMKDCENELKYLQEVLKICKGLKLKDSTKVSGYQSANKWTASESQVNPVPYSAEIYEG